MSFYDLYGDPRELNDFYSAIEQALEKIGVPTTSEMVERGSKAFPRFPMEYDSNSDEEEEFKFLSEDELPF